MTASRSPRRWLFVLTILVGSFLLFLVQPMVARMVLPKLGGAPAVWNSAMLVYQALLLGGYAYAHWLGRVPVRQQAMIHLGVLALAALWLPIGLMAMQMPADAEPAVWVPWPRVSFVAWISTNFPAFSRLAAGSAIPRSGGLIRSSVEFTQVTGAVIFSRSFEGS